MTSDGNAPALTDKKGMGGVIALGGFDYQLWESLVRLPAWLANPTFEELILEGLEDLEAKFFAPQAEPRYSLLERFQAKSGSLTPADVQEVLQSFLAFEKAFPSATRVYTLVTPRLPPTVSWLSRDPLRVRRARPFYAPFKDIAVASDARMRTDLIKEYGTELGAFIADSVEITERILPDRDTAIQAFGTSLDRTFSQLEVGPRHIKEAFEALCGRLMQSVGSPISRDELLRTLEAALKQRLPLPESFPLHIRSDRNETDERALEINASAFSGGGVAFPEPTFWAENLLGPLDRTARWLRARGVSRIALGGSFRLSTAFALGWSLRSAIGFELEIPTREGPWRTDDRPTAGDTDPGWHFTQPTGLDGDQLIVSVGVLRDPSAELPATAGVSGDAVLSAYCPEPLTSASVAQASVALVKRAVDSTAAKLKPSRIRLYIAGPASFAVALGHRWNAMPPTQLHEYLSAERRYVPTVRL